MSAFNLTDLGSAIAIADAVRSKHISALEVIEHYLGRIATIDPELGAFVHLDPDTGRAAANGIDRMIAQGEDPGGFAGVPVGIKDTEDCAGMPSTQGSAFYLGRAPASIDSTLVARLWAQGAVPIGKTAVPELALHSITWSPAFGTTRNPWNPSRSPGGSSGGSAAAVASGMVPIATASDAGGSTRSPAAFSGLVGLKPSQGRIGQESQMEFLAKGCLSRTVADTARFLDVVAGPVEVDRSSLPRPEQSYEDLIEHLSVAGLRAAWSDDLGFIDTDPECVTVARRAAEILVKAARFEWVDRPIKLPNPIPAWGPAVLLPMRGELELQGIWPDRIEQLSPRARARLAAMDGMGAVDIARAVRLRSEIALKAVELFEDVDVLLTPATSVVSLPAEGPDYETLIQGKGADWSPEAHLVLANLTGQPAISVPAGLSQDGLPVGLQIICRRWRDDVALRLARILEQVNPWPILAPAYRM